MFLESITLSGILNENDSKKHNFLHPSENNNSDEEENEENDVNLITEFEFIIGFSLIFDSTFNATYDFSEYITSTSQCEPFVEVVLWQRNNVLDSKFHWLSQNELKLKRLLRQPQSVFINSKKFKIEDFHESIAKLGFLNIDNLNIHRLLDDELLKLGYLVRDDLWNMLMKIIACEELIEMAERKNDTVKKRIMKRTYDNLTNTVCKVLPKKVKLRDDIYNQLILRNNIYTLLHIILERQSVVHNFQMSSFDEKLAPLVEQLKEYFYQQHKLQKFIASSNQRKENLLNISFQIDFNQRKIDRLIGLHLLRKKPCNTPTIEDFSDIILDMKKMIEEFSMKDEDKFEFEEIGWKLLLENDDEAGLFLDSLTNAATEVESISREMQESFEHQFQEKNLIKSFLDVQKSFSLRDKTIFNALQEYDEKNLENTNEIAEILESLTDKAFDAHIPTSFKKALLIIEDIVKSDVCLSQNYIGPVYQFLKASQDTDMNRHVWHQIVDASQTILFKTIEAALMFSIYLLEVRTNVHCQVFSLDKCFAERDLEMTQSEEKYLFAMSLVDPTTPPEIRKNLPYILRKFIFVEHEDWFYEKELEKWHVTHCNDICSTAYYEGSTSVISQLPSQTKVSGIKAVLDMQSHLKKRSAIISLTNQNKDMIREISQQLNQEERSIEMNSNRMREKFFIESVSSLNLLLSKLNFTPRTKLLERLNIIKQNAGSVIDKEELERKLIDEDYEVTSYSTHTDHDNMMKPLDILRIFTHNIDEFSYQPFSDISLESRDAINELAEYKLNLLKKRRDDLNNKLSINRVTASDLLDLENTPLSEKVGLIDKFDLCLEFGMVNAQKGIAQGSFKLFEEKINHTDENDMVDFIKKTFNDFNNQAIEDIITQLEDFREQLLTQRNETEIRLRHLTSESYVKLVESIRKVRKFAEEMDVFTPVEIKKRAFPLMNSLVVKMLRDTVYHFKTTYNVVFSDFLRQSSLFFFTHGSINEVIEDNEFSWNCFDMTRIKSIDFAEKWNDDFRSKVSFEKVKQVKAFLLILHIINYISIFKFIIISSKIFEEMDMALEEKVRAFLKAVSSYIQVIIIEKSGGEREPSPEPMDLSF